MNDKTRKRRDLLNLIKVQLQKFLPNMFNQERKNNNFL